MAARAKPAIAADKLARFDELIVSGEGLTRTGASLPCTSVYGYIISVPDKEESLALRLPEHLHKGFISRVNTIFC